MLSTPRNIYSIICTREEKFKRVSKDLFNYFERAKIKLNILIGANCIFEAYSSRVKELNANDEDIIIFCHDDIEILTNIRFFVTQLILQTNLPQCGFIGAAGTTKLTSNAIWWNQNVWAEGRHRGYIFHGDLLSLQPTWYGVPGEVVVLDGLFLAAKYKVLKSLNLEKPKEFQGGWDFYDLEYTLQAYEAGYKNYVAPIILRHESHGDLVGRDSWHLNRSAFMNKHKLPVEIPFK